MWKTGKSMALLAMVFIIFMSGCSGRELSFTASEDRPSGAGSVPAPGAEAEEEENWLCIYVCGAVVSPGVYLLPEGSRVFHAVEAAGGLLPEADPGAVNQASLLTDGEQVLIPSRTEALSAEGGEPALRAEAKVNLNTADRDLLMSLPGIGEAKAEAVIAWRTENGRFGEIEDIMKVPGIKKALFLKLRDRITV